MYNFRNDYSVGACSQIIDAIVKTNDITTDCYGEDEFTINAIALLKNKINKNCDIHLITGGTQTNLIMIANILKPHEAVISADTGHINVHETGAIESTGHKVLALPNKDGKLTVDLIKEVLSTHNMEHMVKPKLIYISNSTELGTIYTKKELESISEFAKQNDLYLFMDGARLGSALVAQNNDLTLEHIANLVDCFYIGGTKNGAMMGEALVIINDKLKEDFRYIIKQRGALLAKGRFLGIQFKALFEDDVFFDLAKHANKCSMILKEGIMEAGFEFLTDSYTNQLFPILPNYIITKLEDICLFNYEKPIDNKTGCIRFVTSYKTKEQDCIDFIKKFKSLV